LVNSLYNEEAAEDSGDESPKQPVYQGDTTLCLPAEPLELLKPGTVLLEKFKIIELLGQGGMGSVYRVEHLLMNQQFALKCLNKFQKEDAGWRRFKNEAKAAHMLDHANLIKVYEFGLLPGGQPFFLMELVEGVTLADEIERLGHLPIERVIKIFIQVAFAIGYAHDSRVVHRDLKPSNIMLIERKSERDPEIVKVVDFGIAKLTGVDEFNQQTLTKTGEIFGSPLYMSPEQCMGIAVDHRSDLYSLGCVLYEALTSAPPFMGESALSTMMKHQSEMQAPLKEASLGMHFPSGLEKIVGKLLEKDPQNRYQAASQLASDLIHLERTLHDAGTQELTSDKLEAAPKYTRQVLTKEEEEFARKEKALLIAGVAAVAFTVGVLSDNLVGHFSGHPTAKHSSKIAASASASDPKKSDGSNDSSKVDGTSSGDEGKKFWSHYKGDKRVFEFPTDSSMGKIVVANGESYDAKGIVSVPRELPLGIVANEKLVKNPDLLDKFKPDEIAVFDFNKNRDAKLKVFEKVGKLTGLKGLNLYDTEFVNRDLHILSNLKNLLYVNFAFTGVTCEEALKYLPLKTINSLDLTCLRDGKNAVKRIHEMPQLRHILLVDTRIGDDDLKELAKSDHLRILDLAWNKITDKGLVHLTKLKNLEYLDLSETKVTPMAWRTIAKIPNLRKVKIAHYKNTPWSPEEKNYFEAQLSKAAPRMSVNWIYEDNLDYICASTDLTWLNEGMRAHVCPILSVLKDVEIMGPAVDAMTHSASSQ